MSKIVCDKLKTCEELSLLGQVQSVCSYAIKVSEKHCNHRQHNYELMDKVLVSSFKLVKLCSRANNSKNKLEKQAIARTIELELQFLCMLVVLAFGHDIDKLSSINKSNSKFRITNNKSNVFKYIFKNAIFTLKYGLYSLYGFFERFESCESNCKERKRCLVISG